MRYLRLLPLLMFLAGPPLVEGSEPGRPIEDALRATFRINTGQASGTGFIVAVGEEDDSKPRQYVLVTAGHVLEESHDSDCTLVLRSRDAQGTVARKEIKFPVRDHGKPLWRRHPEMDVAAIRIDLPDDADVKPFAYHQVADEKWAEEGKIRVGQDVCIPCFPAQLEANLAGWPVLRKGSIATYPLAPLASTKTILIDYSHFGGDSGAPVVVCDGVEPVVVALVIAMERQTDKTSTPFEQRTVHTPLGLAIAVQSAFVRQTIDLLLKPLSKGSPQSRPAKELAK